MHAPTGEPSDWVRRFARLIPSGGVVLDVAAGEGRHTRFLHGRKHPVAAVDRVLDGLADLSGKPGIELVQADLEGAPWPFAGRTFAGIIVTNYLHRPLLPKLAASLAPEGIMIYETFAQGHAAFGRPSNPDFLLEPNELIEAFRSSLTVVAYEQGIVGSPRRAVQRIAATAGRGLVEL